MKTEIWFDFQDDDTPSLIIGKDPDPEGVVDLVVIPAIGEKVGWRPVQEPIDIGNAYLLDYVVDVRHYIYIKDGELHQEIHVMTSESR